MNEDEPDRAALLARLASYRELQRSVDDARARQALCDGIAAIEAQLAGSPHDDDR